MYYTGKFGLLECAIYGVLTVVLGVLIGCTPAQAFFSAAIALFIKEIIL